MESKENENKSAIEREGIIEEVSEDVSKDTNDKRAGNMKKRNQYSRKVSSLWIWLGVIILIFILMYWLFTIGVFDSLAGVTNG